jgi:hypothetical protein
MTVYYSNTARQTLGARRLAQGKDFGKRRINCRCVTHNTPFFLLRGIGPQPCCDQLPGFRHARAETRAREWCLGRARWYALVDGLHGAIALEPGIGGCPVVHIAGNV